MNPPADRAALGGGGMTSTQSSRTIFRQGVYQGWMAWRVERGPLALILVPQVGGRLMGIQWHGQDLSFVNPDCAGRVRDVAAISDVHECKRRLGFLLWGGDKTWLAPQSRWTDEVPFIDLDSGAYDLSIDEANGRITMVSPVCRETGVQIERTLTLDDRDGAWSLTHTLHNRAAADVTWAPWDVAMIQRPATVFLPTRPGSAFPDGVRTFGNEGVSTDVREQVVRLSDGIATVTCRDALKFKYGVDAEIGSVLAVIEGGRRGPVGLRKSVPAADSGPYAHGCVAEVFNAADYPYFEVELHGPVTTIAPGGSVSLIETASLFDLPTPSASPAEVRRYLGLSTAADGAGGP